MNSAKRYLQMCQDSSVSDGPKNETLEQHREHCEAEEGNCPFEKNADKVDEVSSSNSQPAEECLIYRGEATPVSEMPFGSPKRMAFDSLKYRGGDIKQALREWKDQRDLAEDWGDSERVAKLGEVIAILNGGAKISDNTKTVAKEKRAPLGKKVTQREWDACKREFGTTDNPTVMGYILPDGSALDFSGGGSGNVRGLDHRNIGAAIRRERRAGTESPAMVDAVLSGAIRYKAESNGFEIGVPPTEDQWDRIYDVVDMVSRYSDEPIRFDLCRDGDFYDEAAVSYNPKTSVSRMKADVTEFFRNGTEPTGT